MKLWKKLSLVCGMVLILAVTLCSGISLGQAREKILSLTCAQAENKLDNLVRSFEEMICYYYSEEDSSAVNRSLLHYCFSRFADVSAVLLVGEETVYGQTGLQPEEYLPLERWDAGKRFTGEVNGRKMLIAGTTVNMFPSGGDLCAIYVVEDITPVYESITAMFGKFLLIGMGCILLGLLLIIFLVRCSMGHLGKLQAAAARIAAGNYQERAAIRSRDEIGMLAADFNEMAAAVEHRIQELTEKAERQQLFIGAVTHEFKTPLTAILLNAETLQNTYMEEEERMESLSQIERQCKWLERLVQKLLKLMTLDQAVGFQSVSVPVLFERVRESTAEVLRCREVKLNIQCTTETLLLDPDLMHSALVNLVDNAAKPRPLGRPLPWQPSAIPWRWRTRASAFHGKRSPALRSRFTWWTAPGARSMAAWAWGLRWSKKSCRPMARPWRLKALRAREPRCGSA